MNHQQTLQGAVAARRNHEAVPTAVIAQIRPRISNALEQRRSPGPAEAPRTSRRARGSVAGRSIAGSQAADLGVKSFHGQGSAHLEGLARSPDRPARTDQGRAVTRPWPPERQVPGPGGGAAAPRSALRRRAVGEPGTSRGDALVSAPSGGRLFLAAACWRARCGRRRTAPNGCYGSFAVAHRAPWANRFDGIT